MFELTTDLIEKYDQKYLKEIMNLNEVSSETVESQLEKIEFKHKLLYDGCQFWQNHKESITEFTELVYLMKHYIIGNLYASYDNGGPMNKNHFDSFETLKKLADNGILTTKGQRSVPDKQKSQLEFRMLIPSMEIGLNLLSKLSSLGMNISAIIYDIDNDITMEDLIFDEGNIHSKNIIIYKKIDIFDIGFDDFQKYKNIPEEHCLISKSEKWCWQNDVLSMINELEEFTNIKLPEGYSFLTATIHNQEWDNKQADEILLNEIENLKKNNYTSVDM